MTNVQILRIILSYFATRMTVARVSPLEVRVTNDYDSLPVDAEVLGHGEIHRLGTHALIRTMQEAARENRLRTILAYRMVTGASVVDAKAWAIRLQEFQLDPDLTERLDAHFA